MEELDLRFLENRGKYDRIDVGSGIFIILFEDGGIAMEHICPGFWQDPSDGPAVYRIAPLWPGEVVAKNPVTLRPSLLCLGAANPCGLHGFVENGVWRSV